MQNQGLSLFESINLIEGPQGGDTAAPPFWASASNIEVEKCWVRGFEIRGFEIRSFEIRGFGIRDFGLEHRSEAKGAMPSQEEHRTLTDTSALGNPVTARGQLSQKKIWKVSRHCQRQF